MLIIAEQDLLTWSVLLAGMVLITTALILRARKAHQNLTPREQLERMKQQRGVRGDLEQIMAEVEQLARRFNAQLDARTHHLERLIDEADQRIERLERARSGAAGETSATNTDDRRNPQSDAHHAAELNRDVAPPSDPLTKSVYALADAGSSSDEIARQLDEHIGKVELILALREA
ncbi:MAG: hypothetical protein QF785_05660 [Phycisphaeraceae bacterium]|nr:hypothetical protein [Phycisphaeraceae bacterium]